MSGGQSLKNTAQNVWAWAGREALVTENRETEENTSTGYAVDDTIHLIVLGIEGSFL
jgi:hypothetical protein